MTTPQNSEDNMKNTARIDREHAFQFKCHPGVPCFTQCCQDINIVLTPYDVVRLKGALNVRSDEFIDKYTIILPKAKRLIPLVILKMNEDNKRCPFVSETGCTVYEDRPWPCRMYPLDMADDGTFHLVTSASRCKGLTEQNKHKIADWLTEQGTGPYDEMNELLSNITLPLQARDLDIDNLQIAKMVFMALYNLDKFREFVFQSTFLERFEVEEPDQIEKIKVDDIELLKFSIDWIKFGLFGEKLFWVKEAPKD